MSKKTYKTLSNSEMPGKAVGWYVLASGISSAIKALCDIFTTWYDAKKQKEIEDHKLKNAKELEEKKTEEQNKRTKAREGLYRRKRKRIANGESISDPDLQSDQSPTAIVVPGLSPSMTSSPHRLCLIAAVSIDLSLNGSFKAMSNLDKSQC